MSRRGILAGLCGASLLALGACGTLKPVAQISVPPADLLADCPEPSSDFRTNGDLAVGFVNMRGALRRCNADKAALRAWTAEVTKENPDR